MLPHHVADLFVRVLLAVRVLLQAGQSGVPAGSSAGSLYQYALLLLPSRFAGLALLGVGGWWGDGLSGWQSLFES